jgi:hypothetical protein
VLEREFTQRIVAAKTEFLANLGAVVFDRSVVNEEFLRNLFARSLTGHQAQVRLSGGVSS